MTQAHIQGQEQRQKEFYLCIDCGSLHFCSEFEKGCFACGKKTKCLSLLCANNSKLFGRCQNHRVNVGNLEFVAA